MRRLSAVIAQQIARRTPHHAPPLTVSSRRLYILPTATGGVFALGLIAMALGATNYGNNLAFALTFWLSAVALVSMHRAHRNLAGLRCKTIHAEPVFAGQNARFVIDMGSHARRPRRRLAIAAEGQTPGYYDITSATPVTVDVPAAQRGRLSLPALTLESHYPLGLFRCWTRLAPSAEVLVYPRPVGEPLTQAEDAERGNRGAQPGTAGEEFLSHRAYREGDTQGDIDWKQSARAPGWLVREYDRPRRRSRCRFDYDALSHLGREARLSQLARWVLDAEEQGLVYTLALPDQRLGPDNGSHHRRACLDALACFP